MLQHTDTRSRSRQGCCYISEGSGRTQATEGQGRLHSQRPRSTPHPAQIPLRTWLECTARFWDLTWTLPRNCRHQRNFTTFILVSLIDYLFSVWLSFGIFLYFFVVIFLSFSLFKFLLVFFYSYSFLFQLSLNFMIFSCK